MNKLVYTLLSMISLLGLNSCMSSYDVQGTSSVSTLDDQKLYLKVLKDNDLKSLDSCDVVHGQFHFHGTTDTTRMANIFIEGDALMPLVLEPGDITVKLDENNGEASGTPMNDKLFAFMKKLNQINGELADLVHRHDQAIMDGKDMNKVIQQLQIEQVTLSARQDSLVTGFVTENFDNVLGPGVFFLLTANYEYPMYTPWIEDILSKATDKFKNDSYVKDFCDKAKQNQEIMNGMQDAPVQAPAQTPAAQSAAPAPTPNELAAPAK